MRPSVEIRLTDEERSELERLARGRKVWRALSDRARIVLLAADGLNNVQIANTLGINNLTARKWRNRFAERGMDGLQDEPRPGRPRCIDDDAVAEVVRKTLEEKPRDATNWSTRSMARATGYAPSTIHRIWQAFSLQPHRSETFKLSADPYFVDKVRDIVGLYVDPPQHAWCCVGREIAVQASIAPSRCCRCARSRSSGAPHDYKRNGTTRCLQPSTSPPERSSASASAATEAGSPQVPGPRRGQRARRSRHPHRHGQRLDPQDQGIPRLVRQEAALHVHFTPTSASWLNQVERFFADLTEKQIRRGVHRSTVELEQAITAYIEAVNEDPRRSDGTSRPMRSSPASSASA